MAYQARTSDSAALTARDLVSAFIPHLSANPPCDQAPPITDAIVMTDATRQILFVNEQAEALFGYTAHELVGQPLMRLLPEHFHATHDGFMARYIADLRPPVMAVKALGQRRDGEEVQLEITVNPLQGAGALGILCVFRDI